MLNVTRYKKPIKLEALEKTLSYDYSTENRELTWRQTFVRTDDSRFSPLFLFAWVCWLFIVSCHVKTFTVNEKKTLHMSRLPSLAEIAITWHEMMCLIMKHKSPFVLHRESSYKGALNVAIYKTWCYSQYHIFVHHWPEIWYGCQ